MTTEASETVTATVSPRISNMLRETLNRYFPHVPTSDEDANKRFMAFAQEVFLLGHAAGYQQTITRIVDDLRTVVQTYRPE